MPEQNRTAQQNKSLHSTLRDMASQLNDAGFNFSEIMKHIAEKGLKVPYTEENLKQLFSAIATAMYNKESTTELTTVEMQEVWKVMANRIGVFTGINVEWHSNEPPMLR